MMNKADFARERDFLIAASILKRLHKQALLADEEYAQAMRLLAEKNKPVLGKLIAHAP